MRWNLTFTGRQVFGAGDLIREDRGQQIFGVHPLQLRRNFLPAATAQDGERTRHVPAPANVPHRRIEQRLTEQLPDSFRVEVMKDLVEWKAVRWTKRED